MGTNPSAFSAGGEGTDEVKGQDTGSFPVEQASWNDAVEFCGKLTRQHSQGRVFTLPTEAQWEYAARGGKITRYFFGDDATDQGQYAWYWDNSGNRTHEVGTKRPNPWGLYDMGGNVSQWCADRYGKKYYSQSPEEDPKGPSDGDERVLRCGSFNYDGRHCRAARRFGNAPSIRILTFGFRVCVRLD